MKPNGKPSGKQESGQAENKKQIYEGEHAERNRNLAEAENNRPGGNSGTNRKRQTHDPGNTERPRVKKYRLTKKVPDKYEVDEDVRHDKTQTQEYGAGAYGICTKDLKKHTWRPPGAERKGRASAFGRAPDS